MYIYNGLGRNWKVHWATQNQQAMITYIHLKGAINKKISHAYIP
jgi:hypothetical protein